MFYQQETINNCHIVSFAEGDAFPFAKMRLAEICGFDSESSLHRRMIKDALAVREKYQNQFRLQGIISYYDADAFQDGRIRTEKGTVSCGLFGEIHKAQIEGVYLFLLTAGSWQHQGDSPQEAVYADIWGTGYTDAGVMLITRAIRADLKKRFSEKEVYLSELMGPGYFGIDLSESKGFFRMLKGEDIGLSLSGSGFLLPEKSCAGLYLVLNQKPEQTPFPCRGCQGAEGGCRFCKIRNTAAEDRR